jgi:hypothetical protein
MNETLAITPQTATPEQFDTAFDSWLAGSQQIIDKHWEDAKYTHALPPVLKAFRGSRFIRIERCDRGLDGIVTVRGSAHAFIDITGGMIGGVNHARGSVLKPASWKAPAKHARGNIFDNSNGLSNIGWCGPRYLK